MELCKQLKLKTHTKKGLIQIANGEVIVTSQLVDLPIELESKSHTISVRILSSLPVPLILGLDFLNTFNIQVDFGKRKWTFGENPNIQFDFDEREAKWDQCHGLNELTRSQMDELKEFLTKNLPEP